MFFHLGAAYGVNQCLRPSPEGNDLCFAKVPLALVMKSIRYRAVEKFHLAPQLGFELGSTASKAKGAPHPRQRAENGFRSSLPPILTVGGSTLPAE